MQSYIAHLETETGQPYSTLHSHCCQNLSFILNGFCFVFNTEFRINAVLGSSHTELALLYWFSSVQFSPFTEWMDGDDSARLVNVYKYHRELFNIKTN